jgi:hypothetical protein
MSSSHPTAVDTVGVYVTVAWSARSSQYSRTTARASRSTITTGPTFAASCRPTSRA